MPADQSNFAYFTYTDDNGVNHNKRGMVNSAINAVDGSTAFTPGTEVWVDTKRHRTRKAVFQDPTTFRSVRFTVYTAAAFAALTSASTIALHVPGETATVTYNLVEKIPERQSAARSARQLADHA